VVNGPEWPGGCGHSEGAGHPKQTLENGVRLDGKGKLKGAGDKHVSAEQMELARLRAELARVKMERDILKKRRRTSQGNPREVRLSSEQQKAVASFHGVRLARSQHQWLLCAPAPTGSGQTLQARRQPAHKQRSAAGPHSGHPRPSQGEYGWPKMCKELVARGIRVGKERVRRTMQEYGIKARGKRKFVVTTDSKHDLPIAPNLLQRNFTADQPNQVWTGDITYIATDKGWLYPALVLDLFSRQVVGWSMQAHMQSALVTDALRMAWFWCAPEPGQVFHSDRGRQHCGHEFQSAQGLQDEKLHEPQG